ncbi:GNAT family N-acetyltransferase [Rhizohabitans arisaemae]|uniref:GNAT family N-acetyltransferase n=1 Tax=Rhizohabitans arisaemae TaxID=2720610 RepID=UPI0024B1A263|nr:GNAT family N-acetyltransferase [Rhizohabitans arisaemae]
MADVGVRVARRDDVAAVTDIQLHAWKSGFRDFIPTAVLDQMTSPEAEEIWRNQWDAAVAAPPTPRHRLLVALQADRVVGLASHGPAEDPDLDPTTVAELLTLLVSPDHTGAGHGSRLLNATVDHLREDGFTTAVVWVFAEHKAMLGFLESAGWAPDEARRDIDLGAPVHMVRLATDITVEDA